MEKYLKISDFIVGDVSMSMNHNGDVSVQYDYADPDMIVRKTMDAMEHAINSHDELVAMNNELLAALKRVVGDVRTLADHSYGVHGLHQNGDLAPWNSLFSGGFFESWLLSVDDADAVIAKTEGGAA